MYYSSCLDSVQPYDNTLQLTFYPQAHLNFLSTGTSKGGISKGELSDMPKGRSNEKTKLVFKRKSFRQWMFDKMWNAVSTMRLIFHHWLVKCQRAFVIMNWPSCVVVVDVIIGTTCQSPWQIFSNLWIFFFQFVTWEFDPNFSELDINLNLFNLTVYILSRNTFLYLCAKCQISPGLYN